MESTKPQKTPKGLGRDIANLVREDIEARVEFGREQYGERLRAFNGRSAKIDAYQEALDLCLYLRQDLEEDAVRNETQGRIRVPVGG